MNLRTAALSTALLMLATAAVAPTAQAAEWEAPPMAAISACTPPNPNAWVNACVQLNPQTRSINAYTVDTSPPTTPVCPVNNICANVPIIIGGLVVQSRIYYTIYSPSATYNVNTNQIIDDVCAVLGIVCPILAMLESTTTASSDLPVLPEVDALGNVFEGVTLDETGSLSEFVFTAPDGTTFLVPIAA